VTVVAAGGSLGVLRSSPSPLSFTASVTGCRRLDFAGGKMAARIAVKTKRGATALAGQCICSGSRVFDGSRTEDTMSGRRNRWQGGAAGSANTSRRNCACGTSCSFESVLLSTECKKHLLRSLEFSKLNWPFVGAVFRAPREHDGQLDQVLQPRCGPAAVVHGPAMGVPVSDL